MKTRPHRLARLLALLGLLAAVPLVPIVRAEGDEAARLVVADGQAHTLTVLDAKEGTRLASFSTPGRVGNVMPSSNRRWVYAVHPDNNRVTVLDSGLRLVDHGDHSDLKVEAPFVRGTVYTGKKPIDFWAANGMATVHNDDDGTLAVFDDERLELALDYVEIKGAGTGHNNAVVLEDTVLLSLASQGRVTAYGMDGKVKAAFEGCPGTHGWTTRGTTFAAAGCTDGVMLFTMLGPTVQMTKVGEPAGSPENARVSTITSHKSSPVLVGNFGQGLAIVWPDRPELSAMPLSANPLRFAFDHDGARLIALTADGKVQAVDPLEARVVWRVDAVTAWDVAVGGPRPSIAVGETSAWATDPPRGEVVEIGLATGAVVRRIPVGGTPTLIALVALEGEKHD